MSRPIDLDRRKPAPTNLLFELHDAADITKEYFLQVIDMDGLVLVAFMEDRREGLGGLHVQSHMTLDLEECRTLGAALLAVAAAGGVA